MALYLDVAQARALLPVSRSIDLVEEAFRHYGQERRVHSVPSSALTIARGEVPTMFWLKGSTAQALGVTGVFFGAQFGDYYFSLHDALTGTLLGIVEQAWLTKRRTGATAAVAAKHLARRGATVAALIGAGQIGEEVVRCLSQAFALTDFRVASRTFEGAAAFVTRLAPETTPCLRAVPDAETAVRDADIIVTITLASAPFLRAGWLKPGALICSMGGVPELDFAVLAETNRLIVDDIDYALLRGDLASWLDQGHIGRDALLARIDADIGEVVLGTKPGRTSDADIVLAVIQGMAISDLVTAKFLVDRARELAIGQPLTIAPQMARPNRSTLENRAARIAEGLVRRQSGDPDLCDPPGPREIRGGL